MNLLRAVSSHDSFLCTFLEDNFTHRLGVLRVLVSCASIGFPRHSGGASSLLALVELCLSLRWNGRVKSFASPHDRLEATSFSYWLESRLHYSNVSLFVHKTGLALKAVLELILMAWFCVHDLANPSELILFLRYYYVCLHLVHLLLHL